jgi:hypothetical protein
LEDKNTAAHSCGELFPNSPKYYNTIKMANKHILDRIRILALAITILTSVPLFIRYLTGAEPGSMLIISLHVWFGMLFIALALYRMLTNRRFITAMIRGGKK